MNRKWLRGLGLGMLLIAVGFLWYALSHPEASFPWSNTVSFILYGGYLLLTALFLIGPPRKK